MYKELIQNLSQNITWVDIQPPCPEAEIEQAEQVVGCAFPAELKALLRELNGDRWCILSAREIIENVERNREIFLPMFLDNFSQEAYIDRVDRFLFFASNGCGDYYCYRIRPEGIADDSTIYFWSHEDLGEDCCWKEAASGMTEFLTRFYQDEI